MLPLLLLATAAATANTAAAHATTTTTAAAYCCRWRIYALRPPDGATAAASTDAAAPAGATATTALQETSTPLPAKTPRQHAIKASSTGVQLWSSLLITSFMSILGNLSLSRQQQTQQQQ